MNEKDTAQYIYDRDLCLERHKNIDRRFDDMEKVNDRMNSKLNWIWGMCFTILCAMGGAFMQYLLNQ